MPPRESKLVEKLDPSPDRARRELELQLALGQALRTTKGFGHPDTGKAYSRARELCHDIGEAPQLFPVLFGLWEFHQNQGDLESAVEVAEQMLALAESVGDSGLIVAAHAVMADNLLCVGDPQAAREHAAQAVALYDPAEHHSLASHVRLRLRSGCPLHGGGCLVAGRIPRSSGQERPSRFRAREQPLPSLHPGVQRGLRVLDPQPESVG